MRTAILLILTISICSVTNARATERFARVGTDAFTYSPFSLARSARNQAMAGAGVTDPSTSQNALYNPANLIGGPAASSHFNQHDYVVITYRDLGIAGAHAFGGGRYEVGAALRYVWEDREPITIPDFLSPGAGGVLKPDAHMTVGTLAGAVNHGRARYVGGVSFKYDTVDLLAESVSAYAWDFGIRTDWRFETGGGNAIVYRAGASLLNQGRVDSDVYSSKLPEMLRAGVGLRYEMGRGAVPLSNRPVSTASLAVNMDFVSTTDGTGHEAGLGGLELGLFDSVFLRAGIGGDLIGQDSGFTYGAGFAFGYGSLRAGMDVAIYENAAASTFNDNETVVGVTLDYVP